MRSTTASPASPRRRVRPWAWPAALAAAAALGAGASVVAAPAAPEPLPSASEAALLRAHDDAARLAGVAVTAVGGGSDSRTRDVLRLQAKVLEASLPPRLATLAASPTASADGSTTGPASPAPDALAAQLDASAAARRGDLEKVDGPTASLLASVATGQTLEADRLAPGRSAGPSQQAAPTAAAGPATPAAAPAFTAVQTAEQAAVWTYTVLAARTGAAARAEDLAAADLHRARLADLSALAGRAGVALPVPEPGYALPADAGSTAQLTELEGSATAAWSELVGAVGPALRTSAAAGLLESARRVALLGPMPNPAAAFPGNLAAQAAAAS